MMQVAKWGNSLAVRLPKKVVDDLGLKAGDDIDIVACAGKRIEIQKDDSRERALRSISEAKWVLPEGYKFDRDDVNER